MKLLLHIVVWFFIISANSAFAAPNLIGTWKSNKELSIQSFNFDPSIKPESKELFRSLFGQLEITYTSDQAISVWPTNEESEGWRHVSTYRVMLSTKDKVMIKWENAGNGEELSATLTFVTPDRFWMELPRAPKFNGREYFDRISKAKYSKAH